MRTTVDIPDEMFRKVKVMAAEQGATPQLPEAASVRAPGWIRLQTNISLF